MVLAVFLAGCFPLHPSITQHFVLNLSGAVSLQGTAEFKPRDVFDCSSAARLIDNVDEITVNGTPVSWGLGVFGQLGQQQFDSNTNVNGVSELIVGKDLVAPQNRYTDDSQDASGSITVNPDGGGIIRLDNWQNSLGESLTGTISWTCTAG